MIAMFFAFLVQHKVNTFIKIVLNKNAFQSTPSKVIARTDTQRHRQTDRQTHTLRKHYLDRIRGR